MTAVTVVTRRRSLLALAAVALAGAGCAARPKGPRVTPTPGLGLTLAIPPASVSTSAQVHDVRVVEVPASGSIDWPGVPDDVDASDVAVQAADRLPFATGALALSVPARLDALFAGGVGKEARFRLVDGQTVHGTLLALDGARVIVAEDGGAPIIIDRARIAAMTLSGIPDTVTSGAILHIPVEDARPGRRTLALAYAAPLGWTAEVDARIRPDGRADVIVWATVQSGTDVLFADAALRLTGTGAKDPVIRPAQRVTIPALGVVRVPVARRDGAAARRVLVYDPVGADAVWYGEDVQLDRAYGTDANATTVAEEVELDGVDVPLPAETQVVVVARDGAPVARAHLPALAAGASIHARVGTAAELTGSRRQIEFTREEARIVEEYELGVKNRGRAARRVSVVERLARGDTWRVAWSSVPAAQLDARSVRFELDVPAGGEARARYRVIYTWRPE